MSNMDDLIRRAEVSLERSRREGERLDRQMTALAIFEMVAGVGFLVAAIVWWPVAWNGLVFGVGFIAIGAWLFHEVHPRIRWTSAIPWPLALIVAAVVLTWLVVGP